MSSAPADPQYGTAAGVAFGVIAVLCWSGFNVAAKAGVDAGLAPLDLALLRFGGAGPVTIPLWFALHARIETPSLRRTLILAALGGPVFGVLAVAGYRDAPLAHGMTLAPTAVALAGLAIGAGLLGERVGARALIGVVAALLGLVLVTGPAVSAPTTGHVSFIGAGVLWAAYTALMRAWRVPPVGGTLAVASVSALAALLVHLAFGEAGLRSAPAHTIVTQLVAQGLMGGVLSVAAFIAAARRLGAARAALLPAMTPCVALALDAALGGPALSADVLTGAALVTAGVALTILDPRAPRANVRTASS